MQILKDKRKHKQVRSDSRKMNEQLTGNIATSSSSSSCSGAVSNNVDDVDDDDENEDDEEEDDNQNQGAKSKKNKGKPMPLKEDKVFNDEHTQSMFGGCVSISISEIEL